jgi:hypothetical protein
VYIGCDTVLKNVVLRPLGITEELKSWMEVMESHPSLGRVSVEVQACQIFCYVNIENQSKMMDWFNVEFSSLSCCWQSTRPSDYNWLFTETQCWQVQLSVFLTQIKSLKHYTRVPSDHQV